MSKKTAVELFALDLYEKGLLQGNGDEMQESLELHKQMEREQIIEFAKKWEFEVMYNMGRVLDSAENFYNETYGGQDEKN